jgi:magnesium transporter
MAERQLGSPEFQWIDVVDPRREELQALAERFGLHATSVQDCLDPEHLPKYERTGPVTFLILRAYDEACSPEGDTAQELTRKLALFLGDDFLITVHRRDQPYLQAVRASQEARGGPLGRGHRGPLLADLLRAAVSTYERPIDEADHAFEEMETSIFMNHGPQSAIEQGYYLKRKASVFKRMLRMTLDFLPRLQDALEPARLQDVREAAERLHIYSDELAEDATNLLSLQISLSSQRTNEVMRVLTLFSVFFLPLTFIAGIYGMNFRYMPELEWPAGYPLALGVMLAVGLGIFLWFRGKGWLR